MAKFKAQQVLRVSGDVRQLGADRKRLAKGTRVVVVNSDGEYATVRTADKARARGRINAFALTFRGRPRNPEPTA